MNLHSSNHLYAHEGTARLSVTRPDPQGWVIVAGAGRFTYLGLLGADGLTILDEHGRFVDVLRATDRVEPEVLFG